MNGVSAQIGGSSRNKFGNKRGCGKINKYGSIIYCCFICNCVEHKIYDYPHKDVIQAMFREKALVVTFEEDNVVINMVLAITTYDQILENVVFKEKKPFKNKSLAINKKRKSFNIHLKKLLNTYNKRSCMGPNLYKLQLKLTSQRIFVLIPRINSPNLLDLQNLPILL